MEMRIAEKTREAFNPDRLAPAHLKTRMALVHDFKLKSKIFKIRKIKALPQY